MKISFLEKLVCPFDKQDLLVKIIKQDTDHINEGILTCSSCKRYYPIVYGIPIMSPDEYRQIELEMPILERWGETLLSKNTSTPFQLQPRKILEMIEQMPK
jgi:uncharacterized protein